MSKINILFFGNCQTGSIKHILNLDENKYNIHNIVCHSTDIKKDNFFEIIIKCDIIITQPISDNYREKDYLNTNFIIKNIKKDCKLIIFPSCYFTFYYPDLKYFKYNNKLLREPLDYHYDFMIQCYKKNISIENYISNFINNKNLVSIKELENNALESLSKLKNKFFEDTKKYKLNDNIIIIPIHNYIEENYKKKLLFYSMNHPTKYLLQYITEIIILNLKIENTMNYNICPLGNTKCILYKCIQNVVDFDLNGCNILTNNLNSIFEITKLYYDTYEKYKL